MKTGSRPIAAGKAARIVEQLGRPRPWPFLMNKAFGKPPYQRIRSRHVPCGAPHIKTQTNFQIGELSLTFGKDGEHLAAQVDSEADDQHPTLGAGEKLSEHDAGITCATDQIRPAYHEFESRRSIADF